MSTVRAAFVSSFLLLSACAAHAEDKKDAPASQGSAREVPDFRGVAVSHGIHAEVKRGAKAVRLEGPADLVSRVKLEVEDGVLVTRVERQGLFDTGFRGGKVRLYVTNPQVERLSASGGGSIDAEATHTDAFSAEASGGGTLEVRDVDARKVQAEASGGARVTLSGRAQELDAEASGGSVVKALEVKGVKTLAAEASGGARVEADATERVSGEASGGSVIRLLSRPGQSDVDTSGGSKVVYEK